MFSCLGMNSLDVTRACFRHRVSVKVSNDLDLMATRIGSAKPKKPSTVKMPITENLDPFNDRSDFCSLSFDLDHQLFLWAILPPTLLPNWI